MKKCFILPLLAVSALISNAEVLTPEQALTRASAQSNRVQSRLKAKGEAPKLVYTSTTNAQPTTYTFNYEKAGGFIVVAADDVAAPILAFSDEGTFNTSNESVKYWLECYGKEIEQARKAGVATYAKVTRPEREAIAPLVTTKWDQGAPYYNDCPKVSGKHCYTGCTATAMAQVMKYHNWPEVGTGSKSYVYKALRLSVDFSQATYDWANMRDTYDSTATEEEEAAVAQLMYHCGVGASMQYSTSASGAYVNDAGTALYTYFGYDKSIQYLSRDYYGLLDWEALIYDQLKNVGPIIYSGYSTGGGHTFVCDGYSDNGYFHINWGWSGLSDGYFLCTALDPSSQGIGGTDYSYDYNQVILANICKAKEGSTFIDQFVSDNFAINLTSDDATEAINVVCSIKKQSLGEVSSGVFGLKLKNQATNLITYIEGQEFTSKSTSSTGFDVLLPRDIEDGSYVASLVWRTTDGEWQDVLPKVSSQKDAMLTIKDGKISVEALDPYDLEATGLETYTSIYADCQFGAKAIVSNVGTTEYKGNLCLAIVNSENRWEARTATIAVNIIPGDSYELNSISAFTTLPDAGDYTLCVCNYDTGSIIGEGIPVTVKEAVDGAEVAVLAASFGGEDTTAVDKHNVPYSITLHCYNGVFIGDFVASVWQGDDCVTSFTLPTFIIEAGEDQVISDTFDFVEGVEGQTYRGAFSYNGEYKPYKSFKFTLAEGAGVDNVTYESPVVTEEYYNLQGMKVSAPAAGHYILVTTRADGAKTTRHTIVK
jgi:hypothetical protein